MSERYMPGRAKFMSALISFGKPLIYLSAVHKNARVRVFRGGRQAAAKLDAAIAANL